MPNVFVNVLVALLFAAFAIATIIVIFGMAVKVCHYIFEAFQRSKVEGVFLVILCVAAAVGLVFAEEFAKPYVVELYRQIMG